MKKRSEEFAYLPIKLKGFSLKLSVYLLVCQIFKGEKALANYHATMVVNDALVVIKEVLTLPSLGINSQSIKFTHVTMESEKYICVREMAPQNSVVIIDMNMPMQPLRLPMTADSALMNPTSRILALKAQLPGTSQDHLQIFNIEMKAKVKSHQMPERVVFWKWITPKMLALVTQSSVYHWSIEGESEPVKMFDRTADLVKNRIINYQCDPSEKWLLLIGFAKGPERSQLLKGNMQLFSVDQQRSQAVEAHAASFATFKLPGNENPALLISFASKEFNAGKIRSKLHVIELGAQPGKPSFTKKQADLFFPPDFADDFPVSMQISQKYGLIYVITKQGLLFVYDLETASAVYRNRISPDPIFLSTDASTVGGFYAINRRGQVLLAIVNESTVESFIRDQLNNLKIGVNLAKRVDLPRAENPFVQRFPELLSLARHEEAAESLQGIHHTFGSFPDIQRELRKYVKVRVATESPAKEQRKSTEKRAEKRKACFKYEICWSVQQFNLNLYKGYKLVASRCKQKISILEGNYNDFIQQSSLSKLLGGELTLDVLGYDALDHDHDRGLIILDGEIDDDLNSWYEKILKQFNKNLSQSLHEKKKDIEAIWWNLFKPKLRELRGVFRALLMMYPNNIHGNWMSGIAFIDGQSKLFNMKGNDHLTDKSDFKGLFEILEAILFHRELSDTKSNGWNYVCGEQRKFIPTEVADFIKRMSTFCDGRNLKYYFDIPFFWNHEESVNFMLKVYEFIWLLKNRELVSRVRSPRRFRWQDRVPSDGPLNKIFKAARKKYENFMDYVRFWRDCRQHYKDHEEMDSLESLEVELENTFHCCWRIHAALWDFINENNRHGRLKEDLIKCLEWV